MNVVDKFPALCDVKNGAWTGTDTPFPREDSDDFPSVVATRFGHILDSFACIGHAGFNENIQVHPLLCSPNLDRPPPSLAAFSHIATPVLCPPQWGGTGGGPYVHLNFATQKVMFGDLPRDRTESFIRTMGIMFHFGREKNGGAP